MAQLLDGKQLSKTIQEEFKQEVQEFNTKGLKIPHLAAVLVGDNPASQSYIRNKIKSCERVGFQSTLIKKEADITEEALLEVIKELNANEEIDGYIVQLPLPKHISEDRINLAIEPDKDVDGFHPMNLGKMTLGLDTFIPATPFGIMTMLDRYNIPTSGKNCVVIGRSNIVGTPMSILLSRNNKVGNCTVTLTHSRTKDLKALTLEADIIVAAIGRANFLTADMIKEGAVIIDVGINRVDDASRKRGYRLVGDVDFAALEPKASYITPVPGGVGPMTVTSLLYNTLKACKRKH
ncbi:MAG: bifunctional methylenetetrahydrofolate dehydrogenase/methenyltetrahydrofolate cyclohydrolase FolD [Saprospiraceae bacterium]|nr:bifunctional methylenetetrahydrofolate dehydrogenase/methenyltetrahydrofolate cyclohydrolase FolD [Saprospiraceae bacterium]